jgi:hypothetical protein
MAIATPRNFGKIWLSTLARTGREGRSLSSGRVVKESSDSVVELNQATESVATENSPILGT